jgi:TPR repeat protein
MERILQILLIFLSFSAHATEPYKVVKDYIYEAMPTGDFNHPSWFKAAEELKTPLKKNVPWANYYAAFLYNYGAGGFPENLEKAKKLTTSSANEGFVPAMLYQARNNEYGLTGEVNLTQAVFWYEKSALAGSRSAASRLEEAYSKGELELKPNPKLATKWRIAKGECEKP